MARVRVGVGPPGHMSSRPQSTYFDSRLLHAWCSVFSATTLRLVCGCDTDLQRTTPFCSLGGDLLDVVCRKEANIVTSIYNWSLIDQCGV